MHLAPGQWRSTVIQNPELLLPLEPRPISWRKWAAVSFSFILVISALLLLSRGTPGFAKSEILLFYLLYMSVACTFLPLPTAWIVLWAAKEVDPISVAVIGTVGTCIANLHDYYIIHSLFRVEKLKVAKNTKSYRKALAWFARAPFATLTAASFLPIPIDVVRILAVSAGYSRRLYALATFTGRFPRYLLLSYFGYAMQPSSRTIFVVFLVTAAIGIAKGLLKLREKRLNGSRTAARRGM